MGELVNQEITALSMAEGVDEIYKKFCDAIEELGSKASGRKLANSLKQWMVGSHVRTQRDVVCDDFIRDMEKHLELFDMALEGMNQADIREACTVLVDKVAQPQPANSNSTTCLMKRAMINMVIKYLPYLSKETIAELKDRMETAYKPWNRLPIEKDFIKETARLLK